MGMRYLLLRRNAVQLSVVRPPSVGARRGAHLSTVGTSESGAFSQITGTLSVYLSRTRVLSAMRWSSGNSRLCAKVIRGMVHARFPAGMKPGRYPSSSSKPAGNPQHRGCVNLRPKSDVQIKRLIPPLLLGFATPRVSL